MIANPFIPNVRTDSTASLILKTANGSRGVGVILVESLPTLHSMVQLIYRENELLITGQWYVMGEYQSDHKRFVGHNINQNEFDSLITIYKNHAELLWSLPN